MVHAWCTCIKEGLRGIGWSLNRGWSGELSDPSHIRYATGKECCLHVLRFQHSDHPFTNAIILVFQVRHGEQIVKASAVGGEDRAQNARDSGKEYELPEIHSKGKKLN